MTVFVVGHGSYEAVGRSTFVPRGVEVHFHANFDESLPITLGMRVVATGAVGGSREWYGELEPVPNYTLSGLTDQQRASYAQVDPENGTLYVVGDHLPAPTMLCTGDAKTCDPQTGRHGCGGILGRLAGQQPIHLVACRTERAAGLARQAAKQPQPYTNVLGGGEGDPSFHDRMRRLWASFKEKLQTDPDEAARLFDALPEENKAYVLQNPTARNWSHVRQARRFKAEHGAAALYRFYVSQPADVQEAIDADPALAQQVDLIRRLLATFRDPNRNDASRAAAWARMTNQERTNLMAADTTGWIYNWATAPRAGQPAADKPTGSQPASSQPAKGQPSGSQPGAGRPAVDRPVVDRHNGAVLYGVAYGEHVPFVQAGDLLLVGEDTSYWQVAQHIGGQPGCVRGDILVFKPMRTDGDPAASGWLRVTGCTDTAGFAAAVARIPTNVFASDVSFT
ncbi:MAG TPA: hypothetical protein VLJ59_16600 [Mycobacteriales bacterium]|nr:hypothetical protein [Mycobacteriales bacterium]